MAPFFNIQRKTVFNPNFSEYKEKPIAPSYRFLFFLQSLRLENFCLVYPPVPHPLPVLHILQI